MEPGAPLEDAGTAPAEDEEEAPNFDGDYQKSLRHSWEFAAVAQFCRLFSSALRLRPFSADQLEAALLEPDEHPMFLGELLYKLLKKERDEAYTEKAAFSWEPMLVRKLDAQWSQAFTAHPMTDTDFYAIDPLSRMNIMYALCEWRLDEDNSVREHVRQQVDTSDMADTLRHLPIGEDSKGCRYYFFSDSQEDCRLYREEPPRKRLSKKQAHREHLALWDTVCTTLEEISDFAARLGGSRNRSDKALQEFLTLELLPKLIDTVSARKKADERAAALEAMPKKRSSRLQVLQIKKEEEEKKKREEDEERARMLKEQERVRKDRDREMRLKARQDEEERMLMHAAQLRKKLGVLDPSREERYSKRIRNADDSSNPSPGISGLTDTEHAESFQEMYQEQSGEELIQQAEQEQHHGENGMPLSAAPEQVVKQEVLPKAAALQPPQPINLYPDFPMPPDMHMGIRSSSPAADPWQSEEQPDGGFMPQGRQLRQRQQQNAKGRKREHSPGWSPIGVHVQRRIRHVNTRRNSNMSVLAKFGKPLPPPRLDDYYEGADLSSSSESEEKPPPRSRPQCRGRRKRAKSEDSDPDYEGERSERSGGRTVRGHGARRTTAASNATAHPHHEHGYSQTYMQPQRQQQEHHNQRQQLMARYQSATPLEQERIRQQLMAQRHQQMMQQQGFVPGLSSSLPGSPSMGGLDPQDALRQQMAMQQRQEAMRLLSTLAPEQREQLGRLPPVQQNQFLEQLRQNHMAQQREAARQQQAAAMDAHRQQDLQQRMLASLSAQQLQQLRSMPREAQQASLHGLMQRYHMVEQQRQMQHQHMQNMGHTLIPAGSSLMHNTQHVSGPQAFLQQQQGPTGQMLGDQTYSPRSMQSHGHFSQGQPSSPGLQPSMPDPGMGDWRKQGPQSGPQRLSPSSAMLEPLAVEFGPHAGSAAVAQRPLRSGSGAHSPVPGAQVPSPQPQAAFGARDGNAAGRHGPAVDSRPSLHGTTQSEGHRYDGMEQGAAPQGDVSGSPRYGAPVTTGHDKQQVPPQAHGASDRLNMSSAQVTSGASHPLKPGNPVRTQQHASQPHPASSSEPPVVIITSSTPPAMGLKQPTPSDMAFQGLPRQQHDGNSHAAQQSAAGLEDDRCPSPIPVTLDDFRRGRAEEADVNDLQGLELPWVSQKSQSSAGSPAQKQSEAGPPVQDQSSD